MFGGIDPQTKKGGKIFPNNQVLTLNKGVHSKSAKRQHRLASNPVRRRCAAGTHEPRRMRDQPGQTFHFRWILHIQPEVQRRLHPENQ